MQTISSPLPQLRILCLPGFGTNRHFMLRQIRQLLKLDKTHNIIFIPVDAPFIISKEFVSDPKVHKYLEGDCTSWSFFRSFSKSDERNKRVQYLKQQVQLHGPIHGMLGFSQGATPILQYLQEGNHLRCIIIIGVLFSQCEQTEEFKVPSLHVIGEEDQLFMDGMLMSTKFKDPQVMVHGYGHRLPFFTKKQLGQLVNFIRGTSPGNL